MRDTYFTYTRDQAMDHVEQLEAKGLSYRLEFSQAGYRVKGSVFFYRVEVVEGTR